MKISSSEIALARSFIDKITGVFADMDATDHPLERASIADKIGALIRPDNDNRVVNFADEIIGAKINAAVELYLDLTIEFYSDEGRARRAAETSDRVVALNHERGLLKESPSIDQAKQLHVIFTEFFAANPSLAAADNFAADTTEETAAPSPDLHEKGANAEQQGSSTES